LLSIIHRVLGETTRTTQPLQSSSTTMSSNPFLISLILLSTAREIGAVAAAWCARPETTKRELGGAFRIHLYPTCSAWIAGAKPTQNRPTKQSPRDLLCFRDGQG
jgi:hypothetical protein